MDQTLLPNLPSPGFQALVMQAILAGEKYCRVERTLEPQMKRPTMSSLLVPRFRPLITNLVPPSTPPSRGDTPDTCVKVGGCNGSGVVVDECDRGSVVVGG